MLDIKLEKSFLMVTCSPETSGELLKKNLCQITGFKVDEIYLLQNGKLVHDDTHLQNSSVHVIPKLLGGKGGFGSMLRAIGAQIEKTTNREACRDLSGRRLRDINEEKRLKTWIAQQVEREKDAEERKTKKLEKLCQPPKHEFKDEEYYQERSDLPSKVEDAITQGLQASCSSQTGVKRKKPQKNKGKKKPHLWVDADVDDLSTSSNESDDEKEAVKSVQSADAATSSSDSINKDNSEVKSELDKPNIS